MRPQFFIPLLCEPVLHLWALISIIIVLLLQTRMDAGVVQGVVTKLSDRVRSTPATLKHDTPPSALPFCNFPVHFNNTIVSLRSALISCWDFERNVFITACFLFDYSQRILERKKPLSRMQVELTLSLKGPH